MGTSQVRYGKRLIQAWISEDLLESCYTISMKGLTETIREALNYYSKSNKSELELTQERYETVILEATRLKAKIDELTKNKLKETKKEIDKEISPKNKAVENQLTEEEQQKRWEFTIWPIVKKKITENGIENVLNDQRFLNNFSKALCISTAELKEKIRTNAGVV